MANNQLLASDSFASGSLAAGWSPYFGLSKSQVIAGSPNTTEPNALGVTSGQIWTGLSSDHTSEVTVGNLAGLAGCAITPSVRNQTGSQSGYLATFSFGTTKQLQLSRIDSGVVTQLGATVTGLTISAGDVLSFQAAGCALTVYQNGKRLIYFYDTTYTSGSPGYNQVAATALSNSQVRSWRGYNTVQQDGIWTKQGVVIPAIAVDLSQASAGTGIQAWNVFQDNNAQILSGTVFKTWLVSDFVNDVASAMYYAESLDGKNWTRRASAVLAGVTNGFVFKNGTTYYMYGQASGASGSGNMLVYTSSDGITWAQQTPTNVIGIGTGGTWDSSSFYNIISIIISGGTWYGYYDATGPAAGGVFSTGLATSTDGINWTKYVSNPVIPAVLPSNATRNVNGTYYMWGMASQPGQGGVGGLAPLEIVRYKSTNFTTWTLSAHSAHHSQLFESLNAVTGVITPISILDVGGSAYLYTNSAQNDPVSPQVGQIGLAIGPASAASIAAANEDAVAQIALDSFTSGIGNLSSNWTTVTGKTKLQIIAGNLCEASATATGCFMAYTGAIFSPNQYSEITLRSLVTSGDFVTPTVRSATNAATYYAMNLGGPTGSAFTTVNISSTVAGANTQIGPSVQVTPQVGDVFRLQVITGSDGFPVLSIFQNGFLILQVEDYNNSITSGSPGMGIFVTSTLTNAQLSLWAGGNANVIPTYPTTGPNIMPSSGPQSVQFFGRLPNGQIAAVAVDTHGNLAISGGTGGAINAVDVLGNGQATPATLYGVTPSGKIVAVAVDVNGNLCATVGTGGGNPNTTVDIAAYAVPTPVQVVGREPISGTLYAVPLSASNALFDSVNPGSTPTASLAAPLAKPRKLILCGRTPSGQIVAVALDASGRLCISGSGSSGSVNLVDVYKNGQPLGIQIFGINASGSLQAVPLDANGNLSLS